MQRQQQDTAPLLCSAALRLLPPAMRPCCACAYCCCGGRQPRLLCPLRCAGVGPGRPDQHPAVLAVLLPVSWNRGWRRLYACRSKASPSCRRALVPPCHAVAAWLGPHRPHRLPHRPPTPPRARSNTQAIIYVVDSCDVDRLPTSREEFQVGRWGEGVQGGWGWRVHHLAGISCDAWSLQCYWVGSLCAQVRMQLGGRGRASAPACRQRAHTFLPCHICRPSWRRRSSRTRWSWCTPTSRRACFAALLLLGMELSNGPNSLWLSTGVRRHYPASAAALRCPPPPPTTALLVGDPVGDPAAGPAGRAERCTGAPGGNRLHLWQQPQQQRVACMAGMQPESALRLLAAVCPGLCWHHQSRTLHPCPPAGGSCSASNALRPLAPQVAEGLGLTSIKNRDWSIFKTSGAAGVPVALPV